METETISTYEQSQDKHILDDSMDINISRNEQDVESNQTKEFTEANTGIELRQEGDTDGYKELNNCESLDNKENVNTDWVQNESKTSGENDMVEEDKLDDDNESGESDKSLCESIPLPLSDEEEPLSDDLLSDVEKNDSGREKATPIEEKDSSDKQDEGDKIKDTVVDEEIKNSINPVVKSTDEEKTIVMNDNLDDSNDEDENKVESEDNVESIEKQIDEDEHSEKAEQSNDAADEDKHSEKAEASAEESNAAVHEHKDSERVEAIIEQSNDAADEDKHSEKAEESNDEVAEDIGEKAEVIADSVNSKEDKKEQGPITDESNKDEKDNSIADVTEGNGGKNDDDSKVNNQNDDGNGGDVTENCPLLKETLTKNRIAQGDQQKEVEGENGIDDIEMDDDFDPSLLCPDIAMEVDEAPVITNSDTIPNDGSKSPSLYEPMFSTYVDEMTGAEVSFNLTAEEQQMRHETYGSSNPVQYTKIHCTACNVHLGSALDGQTNRFVHPLLKVLICKDCYHFYTSGEFEKDEDGSELYCRWCGQGGQVMCCSNCEMVFCKKCIRINFGRKKLTEIRDSDDWLCFRCNQSQLMALRVHCCEFIEYVRREISRAATLENAASFMSTDFTQCCISQKKKYTEPASSEPKRKRKKSHVDPDYDPTRDIPPPQPSSSFNEVQVTKQVPILPKPSDPAQNAGVVTQISQSPPGSMFKVGQTTFRPRSSSGFAQPRPRVQVVTSLGNMPTTSSGPGYIKILPGGIRVNPAAPRAQTYMSSSSGRGQAFHSVPPRVNNSNQMKHEWFEKTVRAAARVNSNLSYTLTQLNRAQATATSVEALAVVHNKLQEILSTSINSLIQIRKNLRTEFIAGIKNIRFPPKPPAPQPQVSSAVQDDDVIFVSPSQSPVPLHLPSTSTTPISSINLPSSVSLTKRFLPPLCSTPTTSPATSVMKIDNPERPKVFLRVKSLTALQNVPAECITIPDDPVPAPPPPLSLIQSSGEVTIIESSSDKQHSRTIDKDVIAIIEDDPLKLPNEEEKTQLDNPFIMNGEDKYDKDSVEKHKGPENSQVEPFPALDSNEGDPDPMVHKVLGAKMKVYLTKSKEIDELALKIFGNMNGDASD